MFGHKSGPSFRLAVLIMAVLTSACANENSIYRQRSVLNSRPTVLTMDAKQRNVLIVPDNEGGSGWRICAEASPDVFSALSTSAAADLGFGQSDTQIEARAKAAIAISEAAGTIERTQTINLLRESMYRTCERYLGGMIDKPTFVVQAGRDWRAMIAILAIEQLTRAARPPATIISAGATSASVDGTSQAARELIAAQGREAAARVRKRQAEEAPPSTCATITDENKDACAVRQKAIADATEDLALATRDVETWGAALKTVSQLEQSAANTVQGPSQAGGTNSTTTTSTGDQQGASSVAAVVGNIVTAAFQTDETQLFCLQMLSKDPNLTRSAREKVRVAGRYTTVNDLCLEFLGTKVRHDTEKFGASYQVRSEATQERKRQEDVRTDLSSYLESLKPDIYKQKLVQLRAFISPFCALPGKSEMSQADCVASVRAGQYDGRDAQDILDALSLVRQ